MKDMNEVKEEVQRDTETGFQCSRCGTANNVELRFVACVSTSEWKETLGSYIPKVICDDIQVWQLGLCSKCTFGGYVDYLRQKMKYLGKRALWSVCGLISSLFFLFLFLPWVSEEGKMWYVQWKLGLLFWLFPLIPAGCLIALPWFLINRYRYSRIHKTVVSSGQFPETETDDAFLGEANRVIDLLEKAEQPEKNTNPRSEENRRKAFYGNFPLPRTTDRSKLSDYGLSPDSYYMRSVSKEAIAASSSRDQLILSLPDNWRELLQKTVPENNSADK